VSTASGSDKFLLFPNPQLQPDGSSQIDSDSYAQAYYAAIDPDNAKDTLAKWKVANGFDTGSGTQTMVVFGDRRDLGYGRRMTARQNPDGTIAFLVENYLTNPGGAYGFSDLSLEAAIVQDTRWRILINAIEFSPARPGGVSFAKFFNFDPATGQRKLRVDLDGRGEKAMPGPCITCHGGRGDALTPPDSAGKPLFSLVQNSASQVRGDVQGHLAPFEVKSFVFSLDAGYTQDEQEARLKGMNKLVLCSYALPKSLQNSAPEDACRREANDSEWQGTAAALIKRSYGGDGLPSPSFLDTLVPSGWSAQPMLYQDVVVPSCRACHTLRGAGGQSDIDFDTFEKFKSYKDRIKEHVFDRGNMPLAKIVFDAFFDPSSNKPDLLAAFLQAEGLNVRDPTGAVLRPGRPVADPGPDRVVSPGPTTLSAAGSLFATAFQWSVISGPNGAVPPSGATLTNPNSAAATFTAAGGTYVLQLVASNGAIQSVPVQLTLVVDGTLALAPAAIRFSDIKKVLQGTCTTCHNPKASGSSRAPVFFSDELGKDIDRNGDGIIDPTDDLWFYAEVRGQINFADIVSSPLLRNPAGDHHGGGLQPNFNVAAPAMPGDPVRKDYDTVLNWILNGAPR
jgi:hypothetical protein